MTEPQQLGPWLLTRARDQGLTRDDLAQILTLPVHRIRAITNINDLDELPLRTIRAMSAALDLDLPTWLLPQPVREPHPTTRRRPSEPLYAVLALALGRAISTTEAAEALGWTIERTEEASRQLPEQPENGLRVTRTGDHLKLSVAPDTLDAAARARLLQLIHRKQDPPISTALVIHALTEHRDSAHHATALRSMVLSEPDALAEAAAAGYLTYDVADDGQPTNVRRTPDVTFSLNLATDLHDSLLLPPHPTAPQDAPRPPTATY